MSSTDQLIQFLQQSGPAAAEKAGIVSKQIDILTKLPEFDLTSIAKKVAELDLTALRALMQQKENSLRDFNSSMRKAKELRVQLTGLDKELEGFKNTQKVVDERKKQLDKIFEKLLIRHAEYIENNVTVFTTEFLRKGPRQLGIFRIWIDWNKSYVRDAIRVVNFYKRNGGNDHPCISNGELCMGTAETTLRDHFQQKNLFILLETIMAFLLSEDISKGYIKNWDTWLRGCRKVSSDFSFSTLNIRPNRTTPQYPPVLENIVVAQRDNRWTGTYVTADTTAIPF
jgi:hypothetical protein